MKTHALDINSIKRHITWKRILVLSFLAVFFVAIGPYVLYGSLYILYRDKIHQSIDTVPQKRVAVVLGAGLFPDGSPSDILSDRIDAAVELYNAGKVQKIIMSGDNRYEYYSEPDVMVETAINKGVSASDLQPDYAGRRTYDTCWRAKHIFSQERMIVVTQSFHMTRTVFLCNAMGIETDGYVADKPRYLRSQWLYWSVRDIYALSLSVIDVYIRKPYVVGGDTIQI